jgi:hypothetical protein
MPTRLLIFSQNIDNRKSQIDVMEHINRGKIEEQKERHDAILPTGP